MTDPYAVRLDRDVVAVSGPESGTFLQGQLSQDLLALGAGQSAWSWLLAPTGKVDALVRVTRLGDDEWLLDTDSGWGDAVLTRLNRFRLRTKVALVDRPWRVVGLRGQAAGNGTDTGTQVTVGAWPGLEGVDLLGSDPAVPDGWPVMATADYEAVRIAAGIPRMGAELTDKTIPGETGLIDETVSFTKGCYTGQELVARIDSRGGNVPRQLRRFLLADQVDAGTDLWDGSGQKAGTLTSVAHLPSTGWVALGYLRRGVEPTDLTAGQSGATVEVWEPPR